MCFSKTLSVEDSVAIVIKPNIFMQITFKIALRIANNATIEGILVSYFIHIFLLSSNVHFHKKCAAYERPFSSNTILAIEGNKTQ